MSIATPALVTTVTLGLLLAPGASHATSPLVCPDAEETFDALVQTGDSIQAIHETFFDDDGYRIEADDALAQGWIEQWSDEEEAAEVVDQLLLDDGLWCEQVQILRVDDQPEDGLQTIMALVLLLQAHSLHEEIELLMDEINEVNSILIEDPSDTSALAQAQALTCELDMLIIQLNQLLVLLNSVVDHESPFDAFVSSY